MFDVWWFSLGQINHDVTNMNEMRIYVTFPKRDHSASRHSHLCKNVIPLYMLQLLMSVFSMFRNWLIYYQCLIREVGRCFSISFANFRRQRTAQIMYITVICCIYIYIQHTNIRSSKNTRILYMWCYDVIQWKWLEDVFGYGGYKCMVLGFVVCGHLLQCILYCPVSSLILTQTHNIGYRYKV